MFVLQILYYKSKHPARRYLAGCLNGCLAVTYFRERKLTIIGAVLFHGPVRDGKGWYRDAMAAKRNLYVQGLSERKMG